jgi:hypothetical protein
MKKKLKIPLYNQKKIKKKNTTKAQKPADMT